MLDSEEDEEPQKEKTEPVKNTDKTIKSEKEEKKLELNSKIQITWKGEIIFTNKSDESFYLAFSTLDNEGNEQNVQYKLGEFILIETNDRNDEIVLQITSLWEKEKTKWMEFRKLFFPSQIQTNNISIRPYYGASAILNSSVYSSLKIEKQIVRIISKCSIYNLSKFRTKFNFGKFDYYIADFYDHKEFCVREVGEIVKSLRHQELIEIIKKKSENPSPTPAKNKTSIFIFIIFIILNFFKSFFLFLIILDEPSQNMDIGREEEDNGKRETIGTPEIKRKESNPIKTKNNKTTNNTPYSPKSPDAFIEIFDSPPHLESSYTEKPNKNLKNLQKKKDLFRVTERNFTFEKSDDPPKKTRQITLDIYPKKRRESDDEKKTTKKKKNKQTNLNSFLSSKEKTEEKKKRGKINLKNLLEKEFNRSKNNLDVSPPISPPISLNNNKKNEEIDELEEFNLNKQVKVGKMVFSKNSKKLTWGNKNNSKNKFHANEISSSPSCSDSKIEASPRLSTINNKTNKKFALMDKMLQDRKGTIMRNKDTYLSSEILIPVVLRDSDPYKPVKIDLDSEEENLEVILDDENNKKDEKKNQKRLKNLKKKTSEGIYDGLPDVVYFKSPEKKREEKSGRRRSKSSKKFVLERVNSKDDLEDFIVYDEKEEEENPMIENSDPRGLEGFLFIFICLFLFLFIFIYFIYFYLFIFIYFYLFFYLFLFIFLFIFILNQIKIFHSMWLLKI